MRLKNEPLIMKLKTQSIILAGMVIICSCKNYKIDCGQVKTGTFIERSPIDNSKIQVVRNDSMQIETNLTTGEVFKSKIHWITPCSFSLKIIKPQGYKYLNKTDSFIQNYPYQFNIIDVQKSYYIYTSKMDSANKSLLITDTVFIRN